MLQNFVFIYASIGALLLLFYTPCVFAKGIFKIEYGELSSREKLVCWIPVVNIIQAEKLYTGKRHSIVGIASIFIIAAFAFRMLVVTVIYGSRLLQIGAVVLLLLGIILFLISNMVIVAMILIDTKVLGIFTMILFSIVYPLGHYYIGTFLPTVLKNVGKEEETF